jgi:hypothetical protein
MKSEIGSLVKHIPTGNILKVKSKTKVFVNGELRDKHGEWVPGDNVKFRITECESYIALPKEKSAYDKMRERNMEDAKKLSPSPKDVGQHILWLKMAIIDRVEKIENLTDDKIYTFKKKENGDDYGKFGFSEHYVNLLMHHAYEAGKQNATDNLTRSFESSTRDMKNAMDSIIKALDDNGLLPENENY